MVTHRVISILEEGIETKGDSNEISDGISTTEENFCGKTLFSIPYIGYILSYLQQSQNVMMILILMTGITAFSLVDYLWTKKNSSIKSAVKMEKSDETPTGDFPGYGGIH